MALCGSPALEEQQGNDLRRGEPLEQVGYESLWKEIVRAVVGLIVLGILAGCPTTIKYGSPPRTDRLETLKPGISIYQDVLAALGEPRGKGGARFSVDPIPRTIWFYEYTEASGSRIDLKILLVFFQQERYDGHLWFSSATLIERES